MDSLPQIELPVLPVETAEFSADPNPYLKAAQARHPWLARFSQGYVVHGYQAVADLLADDRNLLSGFGPVVDFYGLRGTMWGRFMEEIVMAQNGPAHTRLRASMAHGFTPRRAAAARPLMRQIINALLDDWAPQGAFDFKQFAGRFPIAVMCGLLGVPLDEIPRIRDAMDAQLTSLTLDKSLQPVFLAAWDTLWDFAGTTVKNREASGEVNGEQMLDVLIAAKNDGKIDETELRFTLLTLILGGYDTSKNQLTVTMKLAVDRPEIYARCAGDLEFCGKVVDESMRHTATVSPWRRVKQDFSYAGVTFRAGETLVLATPLAGRDPTIFPEPEKFDPERPNANRHVGFGRGGHICVGQYLARAQMQEGLHLIAQRLKNPRVTGAIAWGSFLGAWGLTQLPLAFDPA